MCFSLFHEYKVCLVFIIEHTCFIKNLEVVFLPPRMDVKPKLAFLMLFLLAWIGTCISMPFNPSSRLQRMSIKHVISQFWHAPSDMSLNPNNRGNYYSTSIHWNSDSFHSDIKDHFKQNTKIKFLYWIFMLLSLLNLATEECSCLNIREGKIIFHPSFCSYQPSEH